jgi:hypothetical protein
MSEENLAEIMIAKSLAEVITRVAAATERAGRAKPVGGV